ncbi:DNA replication factor C complex subunit Rfc1 [Dipsacomyces acuminosporus]|nr:DNA replication factor C complex subunit Rfc1 [Dipsacomyces acuminosporus]
MSPKADSISRKRKAAAAVYASDEDIDPESFFGSTGSQTKKSTKTRSARGGAEPLAADVVAPAGVTFHDASELGEVKKKVFSYKEMALNQSAGLETGSTIEIPQGDPTCLAGLTFVLTGNLQQLDRKHAEDVVKSHGGRVTGSVSKKTSFLVVGDDPGATKVNKAKSMGTKVLFEQDFINFVLQKSTQAGASGAASGSSAAGAGVQVGEGQTPAKRKKTKATAGTVEDQPHELIGFDASELPDVAPKAFSFASGVPSSAAKNPGSKKIPTGAPSCLGGLVFVVTGNLQALSREEAEDLIKNYGGRVTKAVSKNTSYLVVGDEPGSSKVKKAKEHRTRCLTEDDLLQLIGTSNKNAPPTADEMAPTEAAADKPSHGSHDVSIVDTTTTSATTATTTSAAAANPLQPKAPVSGETELWVDKYKPTKLKELCGHKNVAKEIITWLGWWASGTIPDKRAVLISGPPGIGKTTTAHLVAKIAGFSVLELNASEARSKNMLARLLGSTISNRSIREFDRKALAEQEEEEEKFLDDKDVQDVFKQSGAKRTVVIMDEIDGMSGGDRGGSTELIQLVKRTKIPIICICNDRQSPKVRSLANYCEDLRFRRPTEAQMRARINTIAFRENLKIEPNAITQLVQSTHNDIRQIINLLSSYALSKSSMSYLDSKAFTATNKKEAALNPFDVIGKYMNGTENASLSFSDKLDLYYTDFSIVPLFVQENYIDNRPAGAANDLDTLERLSSAADCIAEGDIVETKLRGSQQWELMPLHAALSCVGPAHHVRGGHMGMYRFPGWLGQNSKGTKLLRLLCEIQQHMQLRVSADKTEIRKSYIPAMVPELTAPLVKHGASGISDVVSLMDHYYLTKDNWEAMLELHLDGEALLKKIPSAVKSTFTREYNKSSHPIAFQELRGVSSSVKALSAAPKVKPDTEDLVDDDMAEDEDEDDDGDDDGSGADNDKLIKAAKPKGKAAASKRQPRAAGASKTKKAKRT